MALPKGGLQVTMKSRHNGVYSARQLPILRSRTTVIVLKLVTFRTSRQIPLLPAMHSE